MPRPGAVSSTANRGGSRAGDPGGGRDWDPGAYDRVSDPQLSWGLATLARLPLEGEETVLDAGCGTGRLTLALVERLPHGKVIAVDGSAAMAERARERLGAAAQVEVSDLLDLSLPTPVDAVFSNAVFHWIHDHDRLFGRLYRALRPGGRLVAQCGGEGNLARFLDAIGEVRAESPFAPHLGGPRNPWYFATPADSTAALERQGFADVSCWLEPRPVTVDEPFEFLRATTPGYDLDHLPGELEERFVERLATRLGGDVTIDYVRLNIDARVPDRGDARVH